MGHRGAGIGEHNVLMVFGLAFNLDTLYMTWLTMAILVFGSLVVRMNWKLVPGGWQSMVELIIEGLVTQIETTIGANGRKVAPLLITLFLFLLIANWLGLVPGFTSPTNDINTTLGLALLIVATVHVYGVKTKGMLAHFKHFIEPTILFLPINIIEEVAKPVTLSFRLFGNIVAGENLIVILGILVPYFVPTLWLTFSVFVGLIQAMIFTMLSMSYLSNSLEEHHTGEKEG
jgi:F-type H+-transporting ATPase subunit a